MSGITDGERREAAALLRAMGGRINGRPFYDARWCISKAAFGDELPYGHSELLARLADLIEPELERAAEVERLRGEVAALRDEAGRRGRYGMRPLDRMDLLDLAAEIDETREAGLAEAFGPYEGAPASVNAHLWALDGWARRIREACGVEESMSEKNEG